MDSKYVVLLGKILEEIECLESFTESLDEEDFMDSKIHMRAVSMALINIGEYSRRLGKEFVQSVPEIPFKDIIGLRDVSAHGYDTLRFDRIWETVKSDVPDLKIKIEKLLSDKGVNLVKVSNEQLSVAELIKKYAKPFDSNVDDLDE